MSRGFFEESGGWLNKKKLVLNWCFGSFESFDSFPGKILQRYCLENVCESAQKGSEEKFTVRDWSLPKCISLDLDGIFTCRFLRYTLI